MTDRELLALVVQALEVRDRHPEFLREAVDAIVVAFERAPLAEFERRQERHARLVRLLRETDPNQIRPRRAAA